MRPFFAVSFQIDVLYLPHVQGYRYGLLLVDVYSNYLYVKPLKDKKAETIRKTLDGIIEENNLFKIRFVNPDFKNNNIWI